MTKIISVNAGSSSLKFQLFDMPQETVLTSGVIERIGLDEGIFTIKVNKEKKTIKQPIPDHTVAVKLLLDALVEVERGSDAGLSDALNLLLGKDLKKKLYDLHRDEDGIVDGEAVANDFVQILLDYKAGKNS